MGSSGNQASISAQTSSLRAFIGMTRTTFRAGRALKDVAP
jgi:hypothetical protein